MGDNQRDVFKPRSYQIEMLEASIKENIIVAMGTGTGKTHIAILRAAIEIERCDPEKRVWFLAPTATLCRQQYEVFEMHLPSTKMSLMTGDCRFHLWSEQRVWDTMLGSSRLIFSTPAVLLDALSHAFIKMASLALIIFDEAHHCTLNNPANLIMQNFFHPLRSLGAGQDIPYILGLTASPVISSKFNDLTIIEQNLSAVAKTSRLHFQKLQEHVQNPTLFTLTYKHNNLMLDYKCEGSSLRILRQLYKQVKAQCHPQKGSSADEASTNFVKKKSQITIPRIDISSFDLIRTLFSKASAVHRNVGSWAADWFITEAMQDQDEATGFDDIETFATGDVSNNLLREAKQSMPAVKPNLSDENISAKAMRLIKFLESDLQPDTKALIFAEQRAVVLALANLISNYPGLKSKLSVGTFIGLSAYQKVRNSLKDISKATDQMKVLEDFKIGTKNLIVATSVLEEGIDVSSCQVVICFDLPKNPVSFIQRRGRARQPNSKFILLLSEDEPNKIKFEHWRTLELRASDDSVEYNRGSKELVLQGCYEDDRRFVNKKTGAQLTFENAMAHLYHFCATVLTDRYSDCRPQFSVYPAFDQSFTAEVVLPISVDPSVRYACSSQKWPTQNQARRDAAFQAYVRLHKIGLINDNLLPLIKDLDDKYKLQDREFGLSMVPVLSDIDPWQRITYGHKNCDQFTQWNCAAASLRLNGIEYTKCVFLLPAKAVPIHQLRLDWNARFQFDFTLTPITQIKCRPSDIAIAKKLTFALLHSVYGSRMNSEQDDFLVYLLPTESISLKRRKATEVYEKVKEQHNSKLLRSLGIVQETRQRGIKRVFKEFQWGYALDPDWTGRDGSNIEFSELYIKTNRLSKKGYLSPLTSELAHSATHSNDSLRAKDCVIEDVPLPYTIFAFMIPTIFHRLRGNMLANLLYTEKLVPLQLCNLELILAAATASSASGPMNYQRLEFLGDCILKYCTSLQLMAQHTSWPESYLTAAKEKLISNKNLTKVSITNELSRFIVLKGIKIAKWRPLLVRNSGNLASKDEYIFRSAKVQADVVESLIGATFVEGGINKALTLLEKFLPNDAWHDHSSIVNTIFNAIPDESIPYLQDKKLEDILGYYFRKKMILREALTHACFLSQRELCSLSYERLEYLGDAILDQIISDIIFSHHPILSHATMHSIRTAIVSTAFLAFTCVEFSENEQLFQLQHHQSDYPRHSNTRRSIWQFMRHASSEITYAQRDTIKRHKEYRLAVLNALRNGKRHPWHLLSRIRASKFFADLVESIIGAIYIDSGGDLSRCLGFLERLGITRYLRRILHKGIDCLHPKERLGILACSNTLRYHNEKRGENYRCWVYLNEVIIGNYIESTTILDAEVNAAWAVSELLEHEM